MNNENNRAHLVAPGVQVT